MKRNKTVSSHCELLYLKKEKTHIAWAGNILLCKIPGHDLSFDLGKFNCIKEPMLGHAKNYLTVRGNGSFQTLVAYYHSLFKIFNNYLVIKNRTVSTFKDLDIELCRDYALTLRDTPEILDFAVGDGHSMFSLFRSYYDWGYHNRMEGCTFDVLSFLKKMKLPMKEQGVALKTMDPQKGPYVQIELDVINHHIYNMLDASYSLSSQDMCLLVLIMLSLETSRRFGELLDLEETDLYRDSEGIPFVKLHARKRARGGELNKAHHRIEKRIYDLAMRYVEATRDIRDVLHTKALFVHRSRNYVTNEAANYESTIHSMQQHAKRVFRGLSLPNRLYFRKTELTEEDLRNPDNKSFCLRFTSSRIRDTFGTHHAARGMPPDLLAVKMGHVSAVTGQKYYKVPLPEVWAKPLSERLGKFYAQHANYFHNPVVAGIDKLRTNKLIRDMTDPDSLDFGGCLRNYCRNHPRIACYLCNRFEPLDTLAEHEKSLEYQLSKKEEMKKNITDASGENEGSDAHLTYENIDRAIEVCRSIISQCKVTTDGGKNGGSERNDRASTACRCCCRNGGRPDLRPDRLHTS